MFPFVPLLDAVSRALSWLLSPQVGVVAFAGAVTAMVVYAAWCYGWYRLWLRRLAQAEARDGWE